MSELLAGWPVVRAAIHSREFRGGWGHFCKDPNAKLGAPTHPARRTFASADDADGVLCRVVLLLGVTPGVHEVLGQVNKEEGLNNLVKVHQGSSSEVFPGCACDLMWCGVSGVCGARPLRAGGVRRGGRGKTLPALKLASTRRA
jgi:hypothetical protein